MASDWEGTGLVQPFLIRLCRATPGPGMCQPHGLHACRAGQARAVGDAGSGAARLWKVGMVLGCTRLCVACGAQEHTFSGAWPPVLVAFCPPIHVCCPSIQLVYAWSGKHLPVHPAGACQEGCWTAALRCTSCLPVASGGHVCAASPTGSPLQYQAQVGALLAWLQPVPCALPHMASWMFTLAM